MSGVAPGLPPIGPDLNVWARRISDTLRRYFVRNPVTKLIFNQIDTVQTTQGEVSWNIEDDTLNIGHGGGVVQQVGLEHYLRGLNNTGAQINNGEVVYFNGATAQDLTIAKFQANGSVNNYQVLGLATQDIPNGATGFISVFGKVRDIDTSAFAVGDIVYGSPTTAGSLTNVRPTAPNDVVFIGIVKISDAANGVILCRPFFPVEYHYAAFSDTTTKTPVSANTAYAVSFNTTDISYNISLVSGSRITVSESGYYSVDVKLQARSTNSSAITVHSWIRKNGTDVVGTRIDTTVTVNGARVPITTNYRIAMNASDYIEIMWATSSTNSSLVAEAANAFAPSLPSARVSITQTQL